ncbi:MAG: bifunctional diaminohydroxyphosphoribosylaminopyrimidine deaminase/5-amino-6-(5-phosphoribosylamino)uracil reductase RibD [Butyrivibrio sp.]|nr:bifunctional diaminohydroxyphosphoribosylaminopyrimidine deaminase/5-amino-6-(5-phosphoribosylamino)uracil reductase RibD [Butyrivibrio sp.]
MNDEMYMRRALKLAVKGRGYTNPNPMVGAVIVKDGRIIGEGYHEKYGQLHAERNALKNCTESAEGATIYVTLEPCCHYGKTPPCTEAIIENGIKRVVVGMLDVNPVVAGNGVRILEEHGIEVTVGVLEEECRKLNKIFIKYISEKIPFVTMKYAMTSDGKIATVTGQSKWITGTSSRENVHRTRHAMMGIMVGVGTVIVDDPMLDVRLSEFAEGSTSIDSASKEKANICDRESREPRNPIRIICDSNLCTPPDARVVRTAKDIRTIIATVSDDAEKIKKFEDKGCEVVKVDAFNGKVDLKKLMKILGEMGIDSIFLEGGGELNFSAMKAQIVDEVQIYMAPKIFGGCAKSPVGGRGIENIDEAVRLKPIKVEMFDGDIFIENEVIYGEGARYLSGDELQPGMEVLCLQA